MPSEAALPESLSTQLFEPATRELMPLKTQCAITTIDSISTASRSYLDELIAKQMQGVQALLDAICRGGLIRRHPGI